MVADVGIGADIDVPAEFRREEIVGPEAAVAAALALFLGGVPEQVGDGRVRVLDTDHRRDDRLLGLEVLVYQQDAGLGLIDVLFVFRVGEEAEGTGFSVLDLGEAGRPGVFIAVDRSLEQLRELFRCEFHSIFLFTVCKDTDFFLPLHP